MSRVDELARLPGATTVLKATIAGVVLVFAAEETRYAWRRIGRGMRRIVVDFEHRERDELLRQALRFLAAELLPVAVESRKVAAPSR